ncbi:hypothetical protein DPMN_109049 [Dreissena polymorpha]|uniref:Uncharacterized protein n=1 Tax=Dreissena polymorpha TaxID=45954 RepID=A0A9D4K9Y9_DREPO|nr:hypothetical protein DPMN_109049 [Dreissena polymorpha]
MQRQHINSPFETQTQRQPSDPHSETHSQHNIVTHLLRLRLNGSQATSILRLTLNTNLVTHLVRICLSNSLLTHPLSLKTRWQPIDTPTEPQTR